MNSFDLRTLRHFGFGATAALLAGGIAAAAPAAAQEDAPAAKERHVERIIVMKEAGDEADAGKIRRFRIQEGELDGPGCDKAEVGGEGDKERTKVVICAKGDKVSAEERAARLEKALARIQANETLSAEHKEKVAAAMREAIDRLRDTH